MRRHDVVDVVELRTRRPVRLDIAFGHDTTIGLRVPPKWAATQLRGRERRAAGPRPAGVIHVVGLRACRAPSSPPSSVRAAICCSTVFGMLFWASSSLIAPLLALGARPVVAQDVEDDRVVAHAEPSSPSTSRPTWASVCSTNPANTSISRRWNGRSDSGMLSQAAIVSARGVSFASAGIQPSSLLPREDPLAVARPSRRRTCPCTCPPTPGRRGAGRGPRPGAQYMRNGLSGEKAWCRSSQAMRLVGHVLGQVVFLVVRRLDRVEVLVQPRFPLRRLAGEKAVEIIESVAGRPAVERAHRRRLGGGRVVPLAERRRCCSRSAAAPRRSSPRSSG